MYSLHGDIEHRVKSGSTTVEQTRGMKLKLMLKMGGDHEDTGPPAKIKININRTSISHTDDEEHITVLIFDIIADNGQLQSAAADSATQTSMLAVEHKDRCFDVHP